MDESNFMEVVVPARKIGSTNALVDFVGDLVKELIDSARVNIEESHDREVLVFEQSRLLKLQNIQQLLRDCHRSGPNIFNQ